MSGNSIFNSSVIAIACLAGLTMTACASSSQNNGSRYGNVYDYESGGNCNINPCGPVVAQFPAPQPVNHAPIYADCSQFTVGCAPQIYAQPAPLPAPLPPRPSIPANCPTGTSPVGDGTCLMSMSPPTTVVNTMVDCPAGTVSNHDGTCMMVKTAHKPHVIIHKGFTPPTGYVPPTTYLPIRK